MYLSRIGKRRLPGKDGGVAAGESVPVHKGKHCLHIGRAVVTIGEVIGMAVQVQAENGRKGQSRGLARSEKEPQLAALVRQKPGIALPPVGKADLSQAAEKILHGAEAARNGRREGGG